MPSQSASSAKILMLLAVAIAGTSGVLGHKWMTEKATVTQRKEGLKAEQSSLKAELEKLSSELPSTGPAKPIAELKATLASKLKEAPSFGLGELSVTPSNVLTSQSSEADLASYGDSDLKFIKITVSGSFEDYTKLVQYLKALPKNGQAVSSLKVAENRFEVSFKLYGTAQ